MGLSPLAVASDLATLVMSELTWEKRVLLVFSPTAGDPRLEQQGRLLNAEDFGLEDRDMTIIEAIDGRTLRIDGREQRLAASAFYQRFDVEPGQFRVKLVGKDGTEKLDSNDVVPVEYLFELIDSMPMRRYEMSQDG